jgi:hypothetical protein
VVGGGEVQIRAQSAQHRVPHRTADQVQLVIGTGERRAQVAQQRRVLVQRDRGSGQQFGILGGLGHVR